MIRYFSADYIFPVSRSPIKNGIVALKENGEIDEVYSAEAGDLIAEPITYYDGAIVPGFVNSHCHLELSHMRDKLVRGKGLIPFISAVISERKADEDLISAAMKMHDQLMFENGIVAVADISNHSISKAIKSKSKIYYHTFIELLGFNPEQAETVFNKALNLKLEFAPLAASVAPHAPYSVSEELLGYLRDYCERHENLCSMHNQESQSENDFFMNKSGGFPDFYKTLNLDIDFFKPQFKSSIQSLMPFLSAKQKFLLVHNTYTSPDDFQFVSDSDRNIYWCFCPNANLYIENKLPDIDLFLSNNLNITLGTDSLASNDKLCILSELKTIKAHFPHIPFEQTLHWATLGGAEFLGIDKRFGSIEKGKLPGLNLISGMNGAELTAESELNKLA